LPTTIEKPGKTVKIWMGPYSVLYNVKNTKSVDHTL
jgi:hypothetical protein